MDILLDRLRRDGIEPDRAVLVALLMNTDRGFALVEMEVLDFQAAAGREADARVDVELEDGAIPVIEDRFSVMPGRRTQEKERSFFVIFSTMVGAVEIARMLPGSAEQERVLSSAREFLLSSF